MCGIVGIVNLGSLVEVDVDLLTRMNDVQSHRGPDGSGVYVNYNVGLGHRRLSIIDLASGQQPLSNEDKTIHIVFNGEIYNFHELTKVLVDKGHVFQTSSDTETIVHAWEEWGEECVSHLRGMFAFAIWDENKKILFIARDRIGIKPLYYAFLENGDFVFGSELKALQVHPRFKKVLNLEAVSDYFSYGYVPDPKTIYENVHKLAPGHKLLVNVQTGKNHIHSYWDVTFDSDASIASADENIVKKQLITNLSDAVSTHMLSDVPLASFLSGGVDSSAIVATMAGVSKEKINTCSIRFNEEASDESPYAKVVSTRYNTNHHVDTVAVDSLNDIDWLLSIYDEPFADSSAIPTYHVCAMAKKHATVVLSGDGGDELFAGYTPYQRCVKRARLKSYIPPSMCRLVFGGISRALEKSHKFPRLQTAFNVMSLDMVDDAANLFMIISPQLKSRIFSSAFNRRLQGYDSVDVVREHAKQGPEDPLSLIQYLTMKTYLPGDILTKVDRASMANSLEVRVPLLDHKFVEWAASVNPSLRIKNNQGKYIFKKSLEGFLSDDILYRKKMGFAIPLNLWLKGSLRPRIESIMISGALCESGMFDMGALRRVVSKHFSGEKRSDVFLWSLLVFESFLRKNDVSIHY